MNLPYRPNACLIIINQDKKILLALRAGTKNIWQLPQGGMEVGFSSEENALREAEEELGADQKFFKIIKTLTTTNRYDFINPPPYAVGRYRGQEQTYFLIEFIGQNKDINLARHQPQELSEYRWCTIEEIKKLAEPRRLPAYLKAFTEIQALITPQHG